MKKLLIFFVLIFLSNQSILFAQMESYNSNIFTDSPISLSSGHYSFNLPILNLETSSSIVNLQAQLSYHSKSVRSIYSGSMFGNGFSLNILPVISRANATDEDNLPGLRIGANGISNNPNVYSYNLFGLSGKFFVYVKNGAMKVQIVEQNEFAQVKVMHDRGSGPIYNISSYENMYFTIIDKNGTQYIFKTKEIRPYQNTSQNRFLNIYLTNVVDKSGKELLNYTYNDHIIGQKTLKQIYEVTAPNYGKIRFNLINATIPYVNSIQVYEDNTIKKTINFQYTAVHLNTRNLSKITFQDANNKTYYYQLLYNPYVGTLDDNGYYWHGSLNYNELPYGVNSSSEFSNLNLLSGMTSGALRRVILPTGGLIDFTYEVNDMELEESKLYTSIENYDFNEVPKIATVVNKVENGLLTPYKRYTFTISERARLFYKITANGTSPNPGGGGGVITDPDGNIVNPPVGYPTYSIYKSTNLTSPVITGTANATSYSNRILEPGTYYLDYKNNEDSKFTERSLKIHTKKTSDLQYFIYAPGIRIKSVKEIIDNRVKNETVFHYKPLNQLNSKISSGYTGYAGAYSKILLRYMKDKNKEFVYYTAVTKEIKGKGFIEYSFGDKVLNDSLISIGKYDNLRKFPKAVKRYDLNKNLEDEIVNDYSFEFKPIEIDENIINVKSQGILKNQTTEAKNYINNQNSGEVTKNTVYSTDYRVPISETVTDIKTNEVTKIESTYQKLGNQILLSTTSKTINNNLLFKRNYNYLEKLINTTSSFYQLKVFNEENKFGEIISSYEVTQTDANGNVLEYRDHLGIYHAIVWGYNNSKKLFQVSDLRYSQLNTTTITGLQFYTSAEGVDEFRDPTILAGLYTTLRVAHPDKLITTYTYYPNKGLRTVTDPNGRTTYYDYDDFNRLKNIKDQEGNFIKSYQYNFINGVN